MALALAIEKVGRPAHLGGTNQMQQLMRSWAEAQQKMAADWTTAMNQSAAPGGAAAQDWAAKWRDQAAANFETYLGKVVRVVDFGAFVEILPGTDGLLHVSEMAHHHVKDVRSEVSEGDEVLVKCIDIDPSGRIRLSRKEALADQAAQLRHGLVEAHVDGRFAVDALDVVVGLQARFAGWRVGHFFG